MIDMGVMKNRISIGLLLAAVMAFWGAGRSHDELRRLRGAYRIDLGEPLENVPPLVAFSTVALGGFSGIIANYLWYRSARMQREGRFFEVAQLADWITKLEPRFIEAWVYQAWNMSYNISVIFQNPEERWRWVRHGMHLLRNEALRYNPANPILHRELAWLFFHKIGGDTDAAHAYYKRAWASEMSRLFEGGLLDYEAIEHLPPEQIRRMREEYRLRPDIMQEIESVFGVMDWRLPQPHAVYWLWRGRPHARDFELLAHDRLIFQSMADMFYTGRHIHVEPENLFLAEPLLEALPGALTAFERAVQEHPDVESVRISHSVFLHRATLVLYQHDQKDRARELFLQLHERYPNEWTALGFELFLFHEYLVDHTELSDEKVMQAIRQAFFDSYFWKALEHPDRADGHRNLALLCWRLFMEPRLSDPLYRERMEHRPSLNDLRQEALRDVLAQFQTEAVRSRLNQMDSTP